MTASANATPAATSDQATVKASISDPIKTLDLDTCFNQNPVNIVYLKADVTAAIVDNNVTNTIPGEGAGEKVTLPAGTVFYPTNSAPGSLPSFTADVNFITFQGTEIHISTSVSNDGVLLFDGKSTTDLFGGAHENLSEILANNQPTKDVDEITLLPWKTLDQHTFYKKIVVKMDWNRDGMDDVFCQTNTSETFYTFTFTDGKTGAVTDLYTLDLVPENFNPDTDNADTVGLKLDNTSLVVQNSKGEYGILSSVYDQEGGSTSYAFRYDPETLLTCRKIGLPYSYQNGQLYCHPYSECLGNQWVMNQTADLADDFTFTNLSESIYYGSYYMLSLSTGCPVFTKTPVNIDISNGTGYEASMLAPGIVILPDRIETREDGTTYLYVTLGDGHEGRFTYTTDKSGYPLYLNGVEQTELFDGMIFGG